MTFVPGYKHDIFVSYAWADNKPPVGIKMGWVTIFVEDLKIALGQKIEEYSLWMDHDKLRGNDPLTKEIKDSVRCSAILLVMFSKSYRSSSWCEEERSEFLKAIQPLIRPDSRVFVVELDKSERPAEFGDRLGYRCFVENPYSMFLGYPQPSDTADENRIEYYKLINRLSTELAEELNNLKQPQTSMASRADKTIFLAEVDGDLSFKREEVRNYLTQQKIRILPEICYPPEPKAYQVAIRSDLEKSDLFVQLLSADPKLFQKQKTVFELAKTVFKLARKPEETDPIIQWRDPNLDLNEIQDDEQRDFLQNETVYAIGLEAFKGEILKKLGLEPLKSETSKKLAPSESSQEKSAPAVFIKYDDPDESLTEEIACVLWERFQIGYYYPKPSARSIHIEQRMQQSHGVMIIYGTVDPEWVDEQHCNVIGLIPKQKPLAIYDGPPEEKSKLPFCDRRTHFLQCRKGINEEELRKFIQLLTT